MGNYVAVSEAMRLAEPKLGLLKQVCEKRYKEHMALSTTAGDILKEAHDIVVGERNTTHGEKERSFQVIADLWNVYLAGRKTGGPVTPSDVCLMMTLLKVARSIQGTRHKDHYVDACGYSAIAGELM